VTLAPISNIESLDFCAISASESNKVPFKFDCEHNKCFESTCFLFPEERYPSINYISKLGYYYVCLTSLLGVGSVWCC
jgi:hypothetical protein